MPTTSQRTCARAAMLAGTVAMIIAAACSDGAAGHATTAPGDSAAGSSFAFRKRAAAVTVSLAPSQITIGQTAKATAVATNSSGDTLAGRTPTWSSSATSVARVSSSGVVTGVAAGTAQIRAVVDAASGTAPVTVTVASSPAPVARVSVALSSSTISAGSTTQATATARDASGNVLTGRTVTWASTNTSAAIVSATGLVTGVAAGAATITATSEGKSGTASVTVAASGGPSGATLLFEEKFNDANLGSRGWYDLPSGGLTSLTSAEHIPGATNSLQVTFTQGGTSPSPRAGGRHLFTPTDSVYLRFWVKHSANWIGSGKTYHPHEFHFITTEDDQYVGPAVTHLTTYMEENYQSAGSYAVLETQDALNIDQSHINQDLTNITENRAVSGCNGNSDGTPGDCYLNGGVYDNGKAWRSANPVFLPTAGPGYKGDWHEVEVYFQMNSIVGGKGQLDGVAQYWVDGQIVIDRHNLLFRTGAHPTMKFNQLLMAPYIGDGSPATQTLWFDDILVMTARPTM